MVRGERKRVPQEFVDELASFLGENLTVDYEERCFHGKPQNNFHRAVNVPDVIVFRDTEALKFVLWGYMPNLFQML